MASYRWGLREEQQSPDIAQESFHISRLLQQGSSAPFQKLHALGKAPLFVQKPIENCRDLPYK